VNSLKTLRVLYFIHIITDLRCYIPEMDNHTGSSDSWDDLVLSQFIPKDTAGNLDSCLKYTVINGTNVTTTCEGQYMFDQTYYQSSRVTEV
jgi:hypothetical protein